MEYQETHMFAEKINKEANNQNQKIVEHVFYSTSSLNVMKWVKDLQNLLQTSFRPRYNTIYI